MNAPFRTLVEQVKRRLVGLGDFAHLHVRGNGPHIVIAEEGGAAPVARLTHLGPDTFGLSFLQGGRWDMLLIDNLEDVVENVAVALAA